MRGLAGHLARAATSVEASLDRPEPGGPIVTASAYYATVVATDDITAPLHRDVGARGEQQAAGGHAALVADVQAVTGRLRDRLRTEPSGRRVRVAWI